MRLENMVEAVLSVTALKVPNGYKVKRNREGKTVEKIPQPWTLVDAWESESTREVALHVPRGYAAGDLEQLADVLAAALGSPVRFRNRGGVVHVVVGVKDFPSLIPFSREMLELTTGRRVILGYDQEGAPLIHDFRVPHLLIGGTSGYGKTDLIRLILLQLIARYTPEQLHIDLIDGKGFSFLPFRHIPHIRRIVRKDLAEAAMVLREAREVMERRADQVWNAGSRETTAGFQWRVVIVDELAMISPGLQVTKEAKRVAAAAYADMAAVACVGREASVGMIMATQRPDVTVIHPQVKQNCDVSIALRCKTETNSEVIIDRPGAELLPCPGRAIYAGTRDITFQVPYVGGDEEWEDQLFQYVREDEEYERGEEIEDLTDYV